MRFLFTKIASTMVAMTILVIVTFLLMKAIPGDPFTDEKALPKETHEQIKTHYGLNRPWHQQLQKYMYSLAKGDLGPSFKYPGTSVNDLIREGFTISALLGLEALFLALSVGVFFGTLGALKQNRWQDALLLGLTTLSISVPSFIFASLLQWGFALKLGMLPFARWGSFAHSILPMIALAAQPTAFLTRLIRSNMIDVLQQAYIHTAKAKGLSRRRILLKHALPQALLPIFPYLGPLMTNILTGSFIIEYIFAIPGLGGAVVNSVLTRDYTFIMGITIFYSFLLLGFSIVMDLFYMLLDPRQR